MGRTQPISSLRRRRAQGALTLIVLLLVIGAGCHQVPTILPKLAPTQFRLVATLEATDASTGPFLGLNNPNAGSTNVFRASTELSSGVNSLVGAMGSGAPRSWDFKAVLPQTYYLNLDVPVLGIVYWSNTQLTPAESATIRVDAFHDGKRVGGELLSFNLVSTSQAEAQRPWMKVPITFRPETRMLEQGKELLIRVTRVSSLLDFQIGTGGDQQSYLEFRYFPEDPLAGSLYVVGGRIVSSSGTGMEQEEFLAAAREFEAEGGFERAPSGWVELPVKTSEEGGSAPPVAAAFAALPMIGLVAVAWDRRRGLAGLVALIVLAVALSGCAGGSNPSADATNPTDEPQPTAKVNETYVDDEALKQTGKGAIRGVVTNDLGFPLSGANVAVLGSKFFSVTPKEGTYAFTNLTPGPAKVRVDHAQYQYVEKETKVETGKTLWLNFSLVPPVARSSNEKQHLHNDYGDKLFETFYEGSFLPQTDALGFKADTTGNWVCEGFYDRPVTGRQGTTHRSGCESGIKIDMTNRRVYAGSGMLEVTFDWTASGNAPRELGLRILNSANVSGDQLFVYRPPKEPFRVNFFPNEADPAHQKFSNWQFFVVAPIADGFHPFGQPITMAGPIHVKMVMYKSVVPFEPAHRDFWGGNYSRDFFADPGTPLAYSCLGCALPDTDYDWANPPQVFIPAGTKEIRGKIRWEPTQGQPTTIGTWNVYYKPANVPLSNAAQHWKKAPGTYGTNTYEFTILPLGAEVDPFYLSITNWRFYLGDDDPDVSTLSAMGLVKAYQRITITATAYRDPNWDPNSG